RDAVGAAVDARRALEGHLWPSDALVRVRMGLHTGEAVERGGDYFGPAVNRAARLLAIAHGGQIVCSQSTAALIGPSEDIRSLGEHRLRDLDEPEQVFQVGDGSFPPLRSIDVRPTNLPAPRTSFIGRERELKTVLDALARARLVTLTGVGGVGKTRLALEAAARALGDMPDGAWLVELGAVADADAVADVTASALGVLPRPGGSAWDAVIAYLRTRRLLLIIDNCEHLIDAVAARIDEVLASCPRVNVLATSREALAVEGEQIVAVPTLTDVDDAVRLLVERALTVRSDLALTPSTAQAFQEVCRRLDGIPLAIELAAARLRSMTAEELEARLDERFRLLVGGRRVAVSRHQTLRNTIDWSYDLLDGPEREVLRRVAIFAGGFDVPAAEALCQDVADDLFRTVTQLADKSLLIAGASGTRTRYRMLETIRDYALERLRSEGDIDVRRRHAAYFARWSAQAGAGLRGPDEADWVDGIELEMENLRTALLWSLEAQDAELCMALVTPLMLELLPTDETVGGWAEQCLSLPGIEAHPL
ncbi:MAG TPA: NB-ARC domain-containing protein, partial [Thermoleophilia bacterium]|nr:NB-ARC domain-containing protein [Thermoleophilia bacterium]